MSSQTPETSAAEAPGYAELHALSNFSFQRGASHAEELIKRAVELGYAAIAITDECSLAGVVRAHQAAESDDCRGRIRLIIGAEFSFHDGLQLVLLAPSLAAYQQLSALITLGRRAAPKGGYRLSREDAVACPDCLVLWRPARNDVERLSSGAGWVRAAFRDAWIAVELHREADDAEWLARLLALGESSGLRCVAGGDVHYHAPGRRVLQDVQTALRHHLTVARCGRRLFPNGERHLRKIAALSKLYPSELLAETLRIADRCQFRLDELRYEYPRELVPEGLDATSHLRQLTRAGMGERWPAGTPFKIRRQIAKELALVAELRYESFFLTVHDIVRFARSQNILCQGRGSAANSAICYALGITAVDPVDGNLLFERFLSRERNEPPDIDVDFEHQRREEVIQYVFNKYGRERAALAATVVAYRSRSAVRDVGRALGMPPEDIDRLSKSLAWWDRPEGLPERLRRLGFDPESPDLRRWMQLTRQLIGFPRHLSQHVGGFVISDRPLSELVPVENASMPNRTVIQWDKDDLETLGLLKVDVLALGMLSAIRRALDLREGFRGEKLPFHSVPREHAAVYDMICRGETLGVFQIESRAQMNMVVRLKPKSFYDLVVEVAIVRPGPIQGGMVHPYLKRRNDPTLVEYPPRLETVLSRTLGVPIFQEQVMQIAIIAAGFSPGEADQMRRSMAAWKRGGGLEKFRERLATGMAERGYAAEFAERIYQQILGFGSYGFPESHAASFAKLVYVSAWLKHFEPAAFFAGLLNSLPMGFYPPSMLVGEAQRSGVEVRAIDVQASDWECTLESSAADPAQPAIRLGLNLVSGLRQPIAQALMATRAADGAFIDLSSLSRRAKLDKRALRALADADALRSLVGHRHAARWLAAGTDRTEDLLDRLPDAELPNLRPPREGAEILGDYRATGLTLRRHPVALLRNRLDKLRVLSSAALRNAPDRSRARAAGLVMFRQRPQTASGLMFMTLEDETGIVNLVVPAELVDRERDALLGTRFIIVEGRIQNAEGSLHLFLHHAEDRSSWMADLPSLSRDFH